MSLFLSTICNKIDKKGRVSVPALFRESLRARQSDGLILFTSPTVQALEGFATTTMEKLGAALDNIDMFSPDYDMRAAAIFAAAVPLSLDPEGRIQLPEELMAFAGITEQAMFVGLRDKFQIWEPEAFRAFQAEMRAKMAERLKLAGGNT